MIIDGKALSEKIRSELKAEAETMASRGKHPGLAVIKVGNDPASEVYVRNKINACKALGVSSFSYELTENTNEETIIALIDDLNEREDVNGILVQLPLPKNLDEKKILAKIDVKKDVDGFSAYQMGMLTLGSPELVCCTPSGVIELIKSTGESIEGKNAVIIGRSNIVGKPLALLLLLENATVTVCHSKTKNLAEIASKADILVAAIGKPKFVTENMVKKDAIVIDVGINRVDGKLVGDIDFEAVKDKASFITPVPGGVGPMTITMLIKNTLKAAK